MLDRNLFAIPVEEIYKLVDGAMKLVKPAPVVLAETMARLGYPESMILPIGAAPLGCTIVYARAHSTTPLSAWEKVMQFDETFAPSAWRHCLTESNVAV